MTTNNVQISADSLDFQTIKENLKTFLSGQAEFTDYNFEGSALNILLDVLAYNTHYTALYTNFALNEVFLDSASKYSSVVSISKLLGYTAKSVISAKAKVNVTVYKNSGFTQSLILPKGTVFNGRLDNKSYSFISVDDVYSTGTTTNGSNGTYVFYDVELIEGKKLTKRYQNNNTAEFVIPSQTADISTLEVRVQENANSSSYNTFGPGADFLSIKADTKVFFVKQREDMYYEVYFGNNTIGKALDVGNIVHIDYINSLGPEGNGVASFSYSSGLEVNHDRITVETLMPAWGGADRESIDSIKFNAPKAYASANRAVTSEDYKFIILNSFPTVEAVSVWGGQSNNPPEYGRVYIAAKPIGATKFSVLEKQSIENFIKAKKGVVSVTPIIVDPKYIYIDIESSVYYSKRSSRKSVGEVETLIRNNINEHNTQLGTFSTPFRYSNVISIIDNSDRSITSNITNITINVGATVTYNKPIRYKIDLSNPIYQNINGGGTVVSSGFYLNSATIKNECIIKDNGLGKLRLYQIINNIEYLVEDVGVVDYSAGVIDANGINISSITKPLEFRIIPKSNDVIPSKEYILSIRNVIVNMKEDAYMSENSVNPSYIFSSSR